MVITSAARTILDVAEAGTAPEQIEIAVAQAVERGMVLPDRLRRDAAAHRQHWVVELEDLHGFQAK